MTPETAEEELMDEEMIDDQDEWLTTKEAATLFGVGQNSVSRIGRGESATARVRFKTLGEHGNRGAIRVYHRRDLDEYFNGPRTLPERSSGLGRPECVYVIILDPEIRPERVKVGCTTDLPGRLATFKSVCPEARILESYPVPISCEGYALALAQSLSDKSFSEVFDFNPESLARYLSHLNNAFTPIIEKESSTQIT